jgi:hypothetical protein
MHCPSCKAENVTGAEWCASCDASLTGAAALGPGSVVAGRYEIVALLGRGGMGAVFKAHDRALDESVAIKVLRSDIGVTREMDRRFRAEIKLARRISHKNVCRIHEYGEDGELRYLSMTLVEGVDLKHAITQRGRLPPEEAFDVALQVAEGLQAIHDEGIVHRDLKTPNIMRDGKGVVRLMDFGIAKQWTGAPTGDQTATGMVVGTPEYMSPEQVRGEKVDGRSDIYALGIVLYEVFTGHVPFHADTPVATLWLQLKEPPPLEAPNAAAIPGPVVPILMKALAKEPDSRYASAREMADDLSRARDLTFRTRGPRPAPVLVSAAAPRLEPLAETTPMPTPVPAVTPTPARTAGRPVMAVRAAVAPGVAVGPAARHGAPAARARAVLLWVLSAFAIGVVGAGLFLREYASGRRAAQEAGAEATAAPRPKVQAVPTPSAAPETPEPVATPSPTPPASPSAQPKATRLAAPAPLAPANGAEIPAGIWPRLIWDPVPGANAYRVALALDASFVSVRVDRRQDETAFDVAPLGSELQPGDSRRYYWRVAALDARGVEGSPSKVWRFTIARPATEASRAQATAAPTSSQASGTLQLTVIPWAEVSIDGNPVQGVPLRKIPLPPGTHVVRLAHPDYEPVQRRVTIRSGETRELTVDLPEEAIRRNR